MFILRPFIQSMVLILGLLFLAACAHLPGGIASSNTPLEGRKYTVLGNTSASDCRVCLLGILPVTTHNSTRKAVAKAARRAEGDALIDVTVEWSYQYWILFSLDITRVEGVAIRFNK